MRRTPFGATMLVLVGIADTDELLAREPPLLVKAQLLSLDENDHPKWGRVLLDRGVVSVEPPPPPPKRPKWLATTANLEPRARANLGVGNP